MGTWVQGSRGGVREETSETNVYPRLNGCSVGMKQAFISSRKLIIVLPPTFLHAEKSREGEVPCNWGEMCGQARENFGHDWMTWATV